MMIFIIMSAWPCPYSVLKRASQPRGVGVDEHMALAYATRCHGHCNQLWLQLQLHLISTVTVPLVVGRLGVGVICVELSRWLLQLQKK